MKFEVENHRRYYKPGYFEVKRECHYIRGNYLTEGYFVEIYAVAKTEKRDGFLSFSFHDPAKDRVINMMKRDYQEMVITEQSLKQLATKLAKTLGDPNTQPIINPELKKEIEASKRRVKRNYKMGTYYWLANHTEKEYLDFEGAKLREQENNFDRVLLQRYLHMSCVQNAPSKSRYSFSV
jgi:hypothetical protein